MKQGGTGQVIRTAVVAMAALAGMAVLTAKPRAAVQADESVSPRNPQQLLHDMIEHEGLPHTDLYEYTSDERSDRTGGHLWTERVVETGKGKIRRLIGEDGNPLSPERMAAERKRLDSIASDPAAFERAEAAQKNDEQHARQMLDSLPRGFLLDNVTLNNGMWRMDYRPNPAYSPSGIEEHVLHGMSGWLTIDARDMRLLHIEGKLAQDVTLGLGLINIRAGSNFASDRADQDGRWRTVMVHTDIRGHALIFKTISKSTDLTRRDFHYLESNLTIPEAVALLEK